MQLVISENIQHLCFSSLVVATVSCKTLKKNRGFVDTPVVSISSPEPVVEGQSVTIACQSEARPAVTSVMWKKGQDVIQVTDDYLLVFFSYVNAGGLIAKCLNTAATLWGRSVHTTAGVRE